MKNQDPDPDPRCRPDSSKSLDLNQDLKNLDPKDCVLLFIRRKLGRHITWNFRWNQEAQQNPNSAQACHGGQLQ